MYHKLQMTILLQNALKAACDEWAVQEAVKPQDKCH